MNDVHCSHAVNRERKKATARDEKQEIGRVSFRGKAMRIYVVSLVLLICDKKLPGDYHLKTRAATVTAEAITMNTEAAAVKYCWNLLLTCEPIRFRLPVNLSR